MHKRTFFIPFLALLLCTTLSAERVGSPGDRASLARGGGPPASFANEGGWMAEVHARLRDANHQFFAEAGDLRAYVPERGLTARFDEGGAHISSVTDGEPITVRATSVGRAEAGGAILATAPELGDCQDGKADPTGSCLPRLEYHAAGITEWWEAGGAGLEQGWVLTERPEGEGPVWLEVEVRGADARVEPATVGLVGDVGGTLAVAGLRAWDARGEDLPARFERGDDGFRVVVDDDGAVYPVEVDPVYTSPDWSAEGGVGFGDYFGRTVAWAGDTNGDGFDDVLATSLSAQTAYLFEGSPTGLAEVAAAAIDSEASVDGRDSVAGAGDVNGDGYTDVVSLRGDKIDLYPGGSSGLSEPITIEGPSSELLGDVAGAGDINGDGYADVVVGTPRDSACTGGAYVYLGSSAGLASSPSTVLVGPSTGSYFGMGVSGAGDVNADGYDDLVVGADGNGSELSSVYMYLGSAAGLSDEATVLTIGTVVGHNGNSVAGAGDVNGDGYDDIIVGAYDSEQAYVYSGSASGIDRTPSVTLSDGYSFGLAVSAAGDVNWDGYDDVVVGQLGLAYVYIGSSAGLGSAAAATLSVPSDSSGGGSVDRAGDTNGDGYDDVIIGGGASGERTGGAWVYWGSPSTILRRANQLGGQDHLGVTVADAGDVNGDGYDDLVVGAEGYLDYTGAVYLYPGSSAGLGAVPGAVLVGQAAGDSFGAAIAGAGDTNGDGYDDVVVGAPGAGSDEGAAYTFEGSATGLQAAPGTTITQDPDLGYGFGYAVSAAGDVNGDGYGDVAVASKGRLGVYRGGRSGTHSAVDIDLTSSLWEDASSMASGDFDGDGHDDLAVGCGLYDGGVGRVYVFVGPSLSADATFTGESDHSYFGQAVATADVNADGYGDLVVGAYLSGDYAGRLDVYYGSSNGLSSTQRTTVDGVAGDELGYSVASVPHGDGDRYDDVVAGALGNGRSACLFGFAGSAMGLVSAARTTITGDGAAGTSVAAGDFNGDGRIDLASGDPEARDGAGLVSVWNGCEDSDHDGFCLADDCDATDPAISAPYIDADGDGYGDPLLPQEGCVLGAGQVWDNTDCDDTVASISPAGVEVCDDADVDEDCDRLSDDHDPSATGQTAAYADEDGDGYGGAAGLFCDGAATSTDCDDADGAVHPGAREVCNEVDDDCDGVVDDGLETFEWYADADEDGYTDPEDSRVECSAPSGYAAQSDEPDCDDADPDVHAGAGDPPGDGIDQNCNGRDTPEKPCGCATSSGSGWTLGLCAVGLALSRRRRD